MVTIDMDDSGEYMYNDFKVWIVIVIQGFMLLERIGRTCYKCAKRRRYEYIDGSDSYY
jgi:hypothetical protein